MSAVIADATGATGAAEAPPVSAEVDDVLPAYFPGILLDVDINAYHAMPGISKSGLDLIERSPAHYFAGYLDPQRPPPKERAGQLEGALAHCAILEPTAFRDRYIVVPDYAPRRPTEAQWNAKKPSEDSIAAMAWWAEFNNSHINQRVITAAQYETAMRQADSARALPEVAEALDRGKAEVSAFWIDPQTGEPCRCRPDWVNHCGGNGVIQLDVKTFNDASPAEFSRQAARKAYHKQAALYSDGHALATGLQTLGFVFVVVESEWPFAASACMLDDASMEAGRRAYRRNLDVYARCRRTNTWPGYTSGIELISLPRWAIEA